MPDGPTILVVEDEPLILAFLDAALTDGGYEVSAFGTAADALVAIETGTEGFQAIVTDIRLDAAITGWSLAHRARELSPHIAVVYITGDSANDWAANGVPGSICLIKPFAAAQLVTAVSGLLNERSPHQD